MSIFKPRIVLRMVELYSGRHEPENIRPIAEMYWTFLIVSSLVASLLILCIGVWQYARVNTILEGDSTTVNVQSQGIDRGELGKVLDVLQTRQSSLDSGNFDKSKFKDPS